MSSGNDSQSIKKVRRILVIDDSEVMLARMKRALMAAGYDTITTAQIVGNARHLPSCDLVIVDYHMPGLNGAAVVESMKGVAQSMKRLCPFYLYTSDTAVAADHAALGFDGVFGQKGDEEALVRQVDALFRLLDIRASRNRP